MDFEPLRKPSRGRYRHDPLSLAFSFNNMGDWGREYMRVYIPRQLQLQADLHIGDYFAGYFTDDASWFKLEKTLSWNDVPEHERVFEGYVLQPTYTFRECDYGDQVNGYIMFCLTCLFTETLKTLKVTHWEIEPEYAKHGEILVQTHSLPLTVRVPKQFKKLK